MCRDALELQLAGGVLFVSLLVQSNSTLFEAGLAWWEVASAKRCSPHKNDQELLTQREVFPLGSASVGEAVCGCSGGICQLCLVGPSWPKTAQANMCQHTPSHRTGCDMRVQGLWYQCMHAAVRRCLSVEGCCIIPSETRPRLPSRPDLRWFYSE